MANFCSARPKRATTAAALESATPRDWHPASPPLCSRLHRLHAPQASSSCNIRLESGPSSCCTAQPTTAAACCASLIPNLLPDFIQPLPAVSSSYLYLTGNFVKTFNLSLSPSFASHSSIFISNCFTSLSNTVSFANTSSNSFDQIHFKIAPFRLCR